MTTITLPYKAIESRVSAIHLPRIHWKVWYITTALLLFSLLVSYVVLVNQLTAGAYAMKSYDKEVRTLLAKNRTLEAHATQAGLLEQVTNKARALGFEKTTNITYIKILDGSLAKAQ